MLDLSFFKGKRVLITGHTGFKGTWLSKILINSGAVVTGYALEPPTELNLFDLSNINVQMNSIIDDIRNLDRLKEVFSEFSPEIVIHMAAQPIVRESYWNPVYTFDTNVMGTVNVCECVRLNSCVKSFLNVTTDKVYENREWNWGYRENDALNGGDPYSNSKSCSELVTASYIKSFLSEMGTAVSTARAGNVIGGGDFAQDRIIPDCIRGAMNNERILVRNPSSIRPYQHVLEPLAAYLTIVKKQWENIKFADSYNVGPNDSDCVTTGRLVDIFCMEWGEGLSWSDRIGGKTQKEPHESNYLKLDCSKIKNVLGWKPKWSIQEAIRYTIEWTKIYQNNQQAERCMDGQIQEYYR